MLISGALWNESSCYVSAEALEDASDVAAELKKARGMNWQRGLWKVCF